MTAKWCWFYFLSSNNWLVHIGLDYLVISFIFIVLIKKNMYLNFALVFLICLEKNRKKNRGLNRKLSIS